ARVMHVVGDEQDAVGQVEELETEEQDAGNPGQDASALVVEVGIFRFPIFIPLRERPWLIRNLSIGRIDDDASSGLDPEAACVLLEDVRVVQGWRDPMATHVGFAIGGARDGACRGAATASTAALGLALEVLLLGSTQGDE